jgi:hypothetical protein
MARITMSIRLGPMVRFQVEGQSCGEISDALQGFEKLNVTVDEMFSDLAGRVYPDADDESPHPSHGDREGAK